MNTPASRWERRTLGSITSPRKSKGIPNEHGHLPFIGMEHVESHTGRILKYGDSAAYVSAAPLVEPGDVLYGRLRPYLNKVALASERSFVSGEFIPLPGTPAVDSKFLQLRMLAPDFLMFTAELDKGDRPRVSWPQIASFEMLLPPLDEQRRIVAILEDHLSRLEIAGRSFHAIEHLVPVLSRSGTQAALQSVPVEWRPLSSVVSRIEAGKSFTCLPRPSGPGEWGVIKVSAMTWGEFLPGENKAVPAGRDVDARFRIMEGDVLVSRANTEQYVGAPVLVRSQPDHLLLSDKSLRLEPAKGTNRDWLIAALQAPSTRRQISALATGTKDSMRNVSQKALLSVEVPVPLDGHHQVAIATEVMAIQDSAKRLESARKQLKRRGGDMHRSLLQAAFSGQLTRESIIV